MTNISQRDAFWTKIYNLALQDRDVVIVSADMGAPALDIIRRNIPSQFINVGIAEQNAIVVSSGLALEGKKVFAYAIAPFITLRCLEQIRVQNAMMKIPITIVGVGAGFGYEDSGPTHHIIEDMAIMRSFPGINIYTVTDSIMAEAMGEITYKNREVNYVRLDRKVLPQIYDSATDFSKGLEILKTGQDGYILATGIMVHIALRISHRLMNKGIDLGVIDIYKLPLNGPLLVDMVKDSCQLITMEEHFLPGGLGSAICEVLIDNNISIPLYRMGLSHNEGYCYKYGGRDEIWRYYGMDEESIELRIEQTLRTKVCK